jgi:hypothetical protein
MLAVGEPTTWPTAPRRHAERMHRARRSRHPRRGPQPEASALDNPPIVSVFMQPSGAICHTWCRQPLAYQGTRARLEADFYCLHCIEHVSLPLHVLPRIPIASPEPVAAFGAQCGFPVLSLGVAVRGAA